MNRVVICGVVTRMITNAKKPSSAVVTATIAINREAPSPFRKLTRLCKPAAPQIRQRSFESDTRKRVLPDRDASFRIGPLGNYCLWDGFDMVNEG